jgi:hypothetical protein
VKAILTTIIQKVGQSLDTVSKTSDSVSLAELDPLLTQSLGGGGKLLNQLLQTHQPRGHVVSQSLHVVVVPTSQPERRLFGEAEGQRCTDGVVSMFHQVSLLGQGEANT